MAWLLTGIFLVQAAFAQNKMTPELLWQLGRLGSTVVDSQGMVYFKVTRFDISRNEGNSTLYSVPIQGGPATISSKIPGDADLLQQLGGNNWGFTYNGQWWETRVDSTQPIQFSHLSSTLSGIRISPNRKYLLFAANVKEEKVKGSDVFPQFPKANVLIYDNLNLRHWDQWYDGTSTHVFYATYDSGHVGVPVDIMKGELYDCPQKPFGGPEDYIWSPDGKYIVYVCKKKFGKAYAVSTNTDLYFYSLETGKTTDFTEGMLGYDTQPAFSPDGSMLAWTSMKTDGYESDKNDIVVANLKNGKRHNLTRNWDGTVNNFFWSQDGKFIYFTAAVQGTQQLFGISLFPDITSPRVYQITHGQFDVNSILGEKDSLLVVDRCDMNHASELYTVDLSDGHMTQITHINDEVYGKLDMGKIEERWVNTVDRKKELVWVIYPPDFDSTRKYPTLLYCEGGPQVPVSQFYSFRWNFQLMAAKGYIIVAPNRRGLPGFGVKWNEEISRDFGGLAMKDYLSAIDSIARLPFVDRARLGCIGASYGAYSVYLLAGIHAGRFRTFIAHDGMFDTESWYGSTDEMWFANHDLGMPYGKNRFAKSYTLFNPITYVDQWTAPILIIQGGIDYRVPVEQGLEAFKAAQMLGIKSKLLYFPQEDHFILKAQDGLVWQHEFFSWLRETMGPQ